MTQLASDDEIELRKFKMFAENVATTDKAIELCKKFLKHKGWDIDDIIKKSLVRDLEPVKVEKHYVGLKDLIRCQAYVAIDDMNYLQNLSPVEIESRARQMVVDKITYEIVKNDAFRFEKIYDPVVAQHKLYGNLYIYKDNR